MRTAGVTRPRWAAASTSRTVRASTETTSPWWRTRRCFRGAVRRAPVWRWPGRATDSSSGMPGHGGRGSMPHSPAAGTRNVPGRGPGALNAEPTCGSPRSTQRAPAGSHADPEPPVARSGDDDTGIPPPNDRPTPECLPHVNTPKRTPFPDPVARPPPEPWPVPRPKRGPAPTRRWPGPRPPVRSPAAARRAAGPRPPEGRPVQRAGGPRRSRRGCALDKTKRNPPGSPQKGVSRGMPGM